MVKMKKGTVIKDIPDNLISEYARLGWKEVKEHKEEPKFKIPADLKEEK